MEKSEVLAELRLWDGCLAKWRESKRAIPRKYTMRLPFGEDPLIKEFRAWVLASRKHPVLHWGAQQLTHALSEYIELDYNGYYCRLRRFHRALVRWEEHDTCPIQCPSRYSLADRRRIEEQRIEEQRLEEQHIEDQHIEEVSYV